MNKLIISFILCFAFSIQAHASLVKSLFLGFDSGVENVKNDILGSDSRFDHVGSSFLQYPSSVTLAQLSGFDSVLVWTNGSPTTGLGDTLADYADAGGHVVLATFSGLHNSIGNFDGRIMTEDYNPFTGGTRDAYANVTMASYDASSSLFDGVTTLSSTMYNQDWTGVRASATELATWNNGRPLAGVNAAGNVMNISLFPNVVSHGHASGDYEQLFRNALAYQAIPEPSTLAILALGLMGLASRRFKKS